MTFRITGLEPGLFVHLSGLSDEALAARPAKLEPPSPANTLFSRPSAPRN